jgi:hypothetical protein
VGEQLPQLGLQSSLCTTSRRTLPWSRTGDLVRPGAMVGSPRRRAAKSRSSLRMAAITDSPGRRWPIVAIRLCGTGGFRPSPSGHPAEGPQREGPYAHVEARAP